MIHERSKECSLAGWISSHYHAHKQPSLNVAKSISTQKGTSVHWNSLDRCYSRRKRRLLRFQCPHCLEIKFEIAKQEHGANVDEDDEVSPVNFLLHSLFRQVDLQWKIISSAYTSYPYKTYVEKTAQL